MSCATFRRAASPGLGLTAAYTWSKTIGDSTNEVNSSAVNPRRPQDFFDLRDERSPSALDTPHRLVASLSHDVPSPYRGADALLRRVFGGWQIIAQRVREFDAPPAEPAHVAAEEEEEAVGRVAVLPFKPLAGGDAETYLGLGLADALITRLSGLRDLKVLPTSAVLRFGEPSQDPGGPAATSAWTPCWPASISATASSFGSLRNSSACATA